MLEERTRTHENKRSKKLKELLILVGTSTLAALVGVINYYSDPLISFQLLYLIPIAISTWFLGKKMTLLPLALCAIFWYANDSAIPAFKADLGALYWNLAERGILFIAFVYVLSMINIIKRRETLLSGTDFLTQIANKRHFFESAYKEINRANRYKHPLTIAYIDMDNFKRVNDKMGHSAGDELLRLTAQALKKNVRAHDLVARVGGDEFAILLPETGYEAAKIVLDRTKREVLGIFEKHRWPVTLSIGAVTSAYSLHVLEPLIERADKLMYDAKHSGKNTIKHDVLRG